MPNALRKDVKTIKHARKHSSHKALSYNSHKRQEREKYTLQRKAREKWLLRSGMSQSDSEIAATVVSEAMGRVLTKRREALAMGEGGTAARLTETLGQLRRLRDQIHSGNKEAISDALSGAWE